MVKKIVIIAVVFFLSFIILAPKERLIFLAEEKFAQNDIILSNEVTKAKLMGVEIANGEISIKGISVGKIDTIDIFSMLFYSSVDVENIKLDEASKGMIPISEFNLSLSHSLFSPKSLHLVLQHGANEVDADITFMDEGQLRIEVDDINGSEWLKPMMKKDENGWYYETAI